MKIVNTTPHSVVIYDSTKTEVLFTYPSRKDDQLRARQTDMVDMGTVNEDVPLVAYPKFDSVTIPEHLRETEGLIVSSIIAPLLVGYEGMVLVPASGPEHAVRDGEGSIIGVTALYLYSGIESIA